MRSVHQRRQAGIVSAYMSGMHPFDCRCPLRKSLWSETAIGGEFNRVTCAVFRVSRKREANQQIAA